jgi:hypothetical protein
MKATKKEICSNCNNSIAYCESCMQDIEEDEFVCLEEPHPRYRFNFNHYHCECKEDVTEENET